MGLVSCVGASSPKYTTAPSATDGAEPDACRLTRAISGALERTNARVGRALNTIDQPAPLARFARGFGRLQSEANLPSDACTQARRGLLPPPAHDAISQCLGDRLEALESIERAFDAASRDGLNARQLAWRVDAKLDWLHTTVECEARAAQSRGANTPQGPPIALDGPRLRVTASLVCEHSAPNAAPIPVARCNGASLYDGDRFKVVVSTNRAAYLYFYLFNERGQFQMFFPEVGVPNRTEPGGQYTLPGAGWMHLDTVSGVFERVLVVASAAPIHALEELRGANLKPTEDGDFDPKARRVRGIIEPLITRGAHIEGDAPIQLATLNSRPAFPVIAEDARTVAVEYELQHLKRPSP